MNKNIIDFLPIIAIFLILLLTWFLPNYSLYDYLKGLPKSVEKEKNEGIEGIIVICKNCNGTGQTEQDVNLLMADASFAIWYNGHMTSNKCGVCKKDKLCKTAQRKYDEIMNKYKKLGPKIEMANCPSCMGMGSYKQYKGFRVGREK